MKALLGILIAFSLACLITIEIQTRQLVNRKHKIERLTTNLGAARDSIRVTVDNNGDSQFNKLSYVVDKLSELEKLNKDLADEIKATKGKVAQIANIGVKIAHDTVRISDVVDTSNGSVVVSFNRDTTFSPGNARRLHGTTSIDSSGATTTITRDELDFTATTGLTKTSNGAYEIFFRSTYPGLTLTKLDGAYITKNQLAKDFKEKRLQFGFQLGYNPLIYNLTSQKFSIENQLSAGIGLNFKF